MLANIKGFLTKLLLGEVSARPNNKLNPAIGNQWKNVKRIWNNTTYKDFGIERFIRLILGLSMFVFPGLYVRHISGRFGLQCRKVALEFYVVVKILLPIIFFYYHLTSNIAIAYLSSYLAIETIFYLGSLIFLSSEFAAPMSYRRSLLMLFINYIELCLSYAVIYSYLNQNVAGFFGAKAVTSMQVIYFSFVTSSTLGYGDFTVHTSCGYALVISQIIVFLIFIALFLNFFASKIQDPTYYNSNVTYPKQKKLKQAQPKTAKRSNKDS